MSARTISRFRVAPFRIYRDCEDNTLSNITLILQARSTGEDYLILYVKVLAFRRNLTCFRAFQPGEDHREVDRGKVKKTPIPTMIIRMIVAMPSSILQYCCCARSSPSSFCHFQPKFSEDLCPPAWKIRGRPVEIRIAQHNYPQVSARNNHGIPRKRLSFPCHVPYIMLPG